MSRMKEMSIIVPLRLTKLYWNVSEMVAVPYTSIFLQDTAETSR